MLHSDCPCAYSDIRSLDLPLYAVLTSLSYNFELLSVTGWCIMKPYRYFVRMQLNQP